MFSVSDMYSRLKRFKTNQWSLGRRIYFAKVDVQSAFDTIPQDSVTKLMTSVPSQSQYTIAKHVEMKAHLTRSQDGKSAFNPIMRWHAQALADSSPHAFLKRLEDHIGGKKRSTVFVDSAARATYDTGALLDLLTEHVQQNIVKVGKKYYRQKRGIPQGSILSSFLCNYFYADLEMRHLGFLDSPDCLLLRLVDDFLLITLDRSKAVRFVETMHRGMPEYGVEVNQKKTLVNFDMKVAGRFIARIPAGGGFPYCGTMIDDRSLDISRDRQRDKGTGRT